MVGLHTLSRRTVLAGFAALPLLAGCRDGASQHRLVRIATGSPTAVCYIVGTAVTGLIRRRLPRTDARVLVTAASAENVQLIATTRIELGDQHLTGSSVHLESIGAAAVSVQRHHELPAQPFP